MATYDVVYNIAVNSGSSVTVLNDFEIAVSKLNGAANILNSVAKSLNAFNSATKNLPKNPITLQINIAKGTEARLNSLLQKIQQIRKESRTMLAGGSVPMTGGIARTAPRTSAPTAMRSTQAKMNSLMYKAIGPTPLNGNGVAAIDFLKGMGIAYGIAGIGKMVNDIIKTSTEYDNLIQSTKNILQTHDKKSNFKQRFASMESVIREVGVQTKFTAPEVADASKFLAMAGLDIDAIKSSIRPIADIALVGDTDLAKTADVVTNIMTAYRKPASQMRNIADVMTMTFTKSNTTLLEMAEAYKYSASLLSAGDVPFEEATAALGVLGDAGIKGSQAGTTLRTIMANIVNPTKKQKAEWDRLGISRTDANGDIKPLVKIFEDLNKADLDVSSFYKLFHKTAAQGAVSLAASVEKWNDIITDNFLSDGLTKKLADEKKNTIQGLWAQLTSAFTEDGVQAFGGVQDAIKDVLRKGIGFLQSSEASQAFKKGAATFMEFGAVIANSVKRIVAMFEKYGWAIKTYFKLQLNIYPIIAAIKAVQSLLNAWKLLSVIKMGGGAMRLIGMANGAGAFVGRPELINTPLIMGAAIGPNGVIATNRGTGSGVWGAMNSASYAMSGGMLPLTKANMRQAAKATMATMPTKLNKEQLRNLWGEKRVDYMRQTYGIDTSKWKEGHYKQFYAANRVNGADWQRDQNLIRSQYTASAKRQSDVLQAIRRKEGVKAAHEFRNQRLMAGAASAAAGAGMWALTYQATGGSSTGTAMGGLTAAMGVAAMGGPVGWIGAAVVGVGALGWAWYKSTQETKLAHSALDAYIDSIRVVNGLWTGEGATAAMKQLGIMYNKNLSLNDLMKERVTLMRELLGLSSSTIDTTGTSINIQPAKSLMDKLGAVDHWYDSTSMATRSIEVMNELAGEKVVSHSGFTIGPGFYHQATWNYKDHNGKWVNINNPDGTSDQSDVLQAVSAAYLLAANGTEAQEITNRFTDLKKRALWGGLGIDNVRGISKEFETQYSKEALFNGKWVTHLDGSREYVPARVDKNSYLDKWNYSAEEVAQWSGADWSTKAPYLQRLNEIFAPLFGQEASFNQIAEQYFARKANGTLDEGVILKYIAEMDNGLGLFLKDYTTQSLSQWYASMGIDPATGEIMGIAGKFNAAENAEAIAGWVDMMQKLIPRLSPEEQAKLKGFSDNLDYLKALAAGQAAVASGDAKPVASGQYKDGDVVTLYGKDWKRVNGEWIPTDFDPEKLKAKPTETAASVVTKTAQASKLASNASKTLWEVIGDEFKNVWNTFKTEGAKLINVIKTEIGNVWNTFISENPFAKLIRFFVEQIPNLISIIWSKAVAFVNDIWSNITSILSNAWNSLTSTISELWEGFKNGIVNFFNWIGDGLSAAWESIKVCVVAFAAPIINSISQMWDQITVVLTALWVNIVTKIQSVWQTIEITVTGLWVGIKTIGSQVVDSIVEMWNSLTSTISELWEGFKQAAFDVWNSISSFLQPVWNTIASIATHLWNIATTVWNYMVAAFKALTGWIQPVAEAIVNGVAHVWNQFTAFVTSIWNAITSAFSTIWEKFKEYLPDWLTGGKDKENPAKTVPPVQAPSPVTPVALPEYPTLTLDDASVNAIQHSPNPASSPEDTPHNSTEGKTGSDPDYKNKYKSASAAPKQIVINIENLMNVDSIDMTNPDNQVVINNVKEQVAQALMDACADFAHSSRHLG